LFAGFSFIATHDCVIPGTTTDTFETDIRGRTALTIITVKAIIGIELLTLPSFGHTRIESANVPVVTVFLQPRNTDSGGTKVSNIAEIAVVTRHPLKSYGVLKAIASHRIA